MIIDGENVTSDKKFDVINPYTGETVASLPVATPEQIQQALTLSYEANTKLSASDRARILHDLSNKLKSNKRKFAQLITTESGICINDSIHEIERVSDVALFSSLVAESIERDTTNDYIFGSQNDRPRLKVITEPLDLIVGITPFNHPMNQVAHKVLPSVAAGTSIVLKPSSKTPLSAIKLAQLLLDAGLEKNMLNVITGVPAVEIVDQMITSPLIDMVTFTGGFEAGLYIAKKMANSGNAFSKLVSELGGCSSFIINDDADIDRSVENAINGCFKNSGQRCTAIRRIIVLKSVANEFVDKFANEAEKITCGDPLDDNTDIGTVISEEAAKKIQSRVNNAIKDGAKLLLGNQRQGALYSPTILDNVSINSELVAKETFGPVASIIRVENIDEAIRFANKTNYRLAGAIMTKSKDLAEKVSNALLVGQFSWNGIPGYRTEAAPFGGFKSSGNGEKEGVILATQGMRRIRTYYEH